MALTWDLNKINNYEEVCWFKNDDGSDKLNPKTEGLIWLTMAIGMGSITEDNADVFFSRISTYEKLFGSILSMYGDNGREEVPITPEDVYAHIGLRTNVAKESDASFRKGMFDRASDSAKNSFKNFVKSLDKESVDE